MSAVTATLTRWRIEWLVLLLRCKLYRDAVRLETQSYRFDVEKIKIAEGLTEQEFLQYATNLREQLELRDERWQTLKAFTHLLRTLRPTAEDTRQLEQVEKLLRQTVWGQA